MKPVHLVLIGSLVTVTGCSGGPALKVRLATFSAPTGWTKGMSDDQVVTIGIPPSWKQGVDKTLTGADLMSGIAPSPSDMIGSGIPSIPSEQSSSAPSEQDVQKAVESMESSFEKAAEEAERRELEELKSKGIILNVISSTRPTIGEARTRFFVKKNSQGSNWNWDEAHAQERGQYFNKPVAKEIELPIGKAHRMEESRQLVDGAQLTIISYLVPHGKDLYTLRFVTVEQATVITSIEQDVAKSLRIQP